MYISLVGLNFLYYSSHKKKKRKKRDRDEEDAPKRDEDAVKHGKYINYMSLCL